MASAVDLNLDDIAASINQLSEEDVRKQLMSIRTRQRVQQKKYHDPEKSKAYRQKKAEMIKMLTDRAKAAGFYDEILKAADEAADQKLAEAQAEEEEVEVG